MRAALAPMPLRPGLLLLPNVSRLRICRTPCSLPRQCGARLHLLKPSDLTLPCLATALGAAASMCMDKLFQTCCCAIFNISITGPGCIQQRLPCRLVEELKAKYA